MEMTSRDFKSAEYMIEGTSMSASRDLPVIVLEGKRVKYF